MMTRDEFVKLAQPRREQAVSEARRLAGSVAAAEVSVANLTANPDFNRFLSYLQGALETCRAQRAALLERIADPQQVDPIETARIKAELTRTGARTEILEHVIALPAALQRDGEKARGLLARMGEEKADAA